jgi:alkanesulfonate monooxygenase SsuD/methylene tetrahydromethanopterin reductase-like flavin-dependent oxidoreductase (luciferase family)
MELGTLLPLGDIGGEPAVLREYAQAAEAIGYDFVEAPDHVLGASEASAKEPGRTGAGLFHDPFVLCSAISPAAPRSSAFRPAF